MVKFLLQRPIAVLMTFTACFILGWVTYLTLPVSLLPDIAIPEITVQVTGENVSARELENTMVTPLRRQLMQVGNLNEIHSETRDGSGVIRLRLEFGTNTDLAYIEVNEKIDAAMNSFPKETIRPKAIKASATDIPVFYLNLTLKADSAYQEGDEQRFLQLCEVTENVIKRRIEQLPQVAMADMTGAPGREIQVVPDGARMQSAGVTWTDLETALKNNNVEPGSMVVRDGYYEYNIRVSSLLRTVEDVENIYLNKQGRLLQLRDFCTVQMAAQAEQGRSLANGKRAVTLAIVKQSDENMDDLKSELQKSLDYFAELYPEVDFEVCRNQTELLDYTIANLQQNLLLGFILILLVAFLFMGDVKSPVIIGVCMIVSVVSSFLLFYLFHVSFNIISLSGLILAVGMMIDNAIIVTENIAQEQARGLTLFEACVRGTSEMITPMLSSSLTTVAVFLPLIFMSGMAGAIFYDEAFAVTSGLTVSYIVSICLLPVLYLLLTGARGRRWQWVARTYASPVKNQTMLRLYDRGASFIFRRPRRWAVGALLTLPLCVLLFLWVGKERMPEIDQNELVASIEWNEHIHVKENACRVNHVLQQCEALSTLHTAYVGRQDFLLDHGSELSASESELYFQTRNARDVAPLQQQLQQMIQQDYPEATVTFAPPETLFERLFRTGEAEVTLEVQPKEKDTAPEAAALRRLERELSETLRQPAQTLAFQQQLNLVIDREKLLLYQVSFDELSNTLRTAFKENQVSTLRSYQLYLPIYFAGERQSIQQVLQNTFVHSAGDAVGEMQAIPLRELVRVMPGEDLKQIVAGRNGEYIPFDYYRVEHPNRLVDEAQSYFRNSKTWEATLAGSFFSNKKMMGEMVIILCISVLLMYFILAAQFESFLQPLIVLMEIPIDTAFALLVLGLCGHTLNLMSAIGIIVTCGIIINDSILKLNTINELRKQGMPLLDAIHEAGHRRLRAIVMTSLTTIFAMVPMLFSYDMGSELQQPLAVAMIAAMTLGTLVSLFVVPLFYWLIYRTDGRR